MDHNLDNHPHSKYIPTLLLGFPMLVSAIPSAGLFLKTILNLCWLLLHGTTRIVFFYFASKNSQVCPACLRPSSNGYNTASSVYRSDYTAGPFPSVFLILGAVVEAYSHFMDYPLGLLLLTRSTCSALLPETPSLSCQRSSKSSKTARMSPRRNSASGSKYVSKTHTTGLKYLNRIYFLRHQLGHHKIGPYAIACHHPNMVYGP